MKRICILTHSHLCRNPRVVKEANSLQKAGYDVTVLTTWTDRKMLDEDLSLIDTDRIRYTAAVNIIRGESSWWTRMKTRIERRIASELVAKTGIESVRALGYGYKRNLKQAIRENADLYICHQELPTIIGSKLISMGFRVAFDFEDWYSKDLLPDANRFRPVGKLDKCETLALQQSPLTYTTSLALSRKLAEHAGSMPPKVLLNVFPHKERLMIDGKTIDRVRTDRVSLHWFSQIIGPGRGLEELAEALNIIEEPFELHLRGNITETYRIELKNRFILRVEQDVYIHPLVSHQELLSRIAEHDIGLALEKTTPESRNLTITNKIMQFLQGGLAVVASATEGQKEISDIAGEAVAVFNGHHDLASKLINWISNPQELIRAKKRAGSIAERQFCWDQEEHKLIRWINNVLN